MLLTVGQTSILVRHGEELHCTGCLKTHPISEPYARIPHVARLLLERGANVNAQDNEHAVPLLQVLEART